jgi:hypothetical protein
MSHLYFPSSGGALRRFLSELDDDEAERFIDRLSRLVECLRDDDAT